MPRYVIKIKIAIPVAVGKCICQIHIMQKQMRIYGHWIELKLICCSGKQRLPRCPLHVARCPRCPTPFSVDVSVQLSQLPGTQKSMLRFWWPDKRVTGDKPRGKLATAIYELVVSCQLIMFMCTAKPQQVVYDKERERRRQREERETMTDKAKQTANSVERNQSNEPCWLK